MGERRRFVPRMDYWSATLKTHSLVVHSIQDSLRGNARAVAAARAPRGLIIHGEMEVRILSSEIRTFHIALLVLIKGFIVLKCAFMYSFSGRHWKM